MKKPRKNMTFSAQGKRRNSDERMIKFGVYAVAFLFLGSMVAGAMLEGAGSQRTIELPTGQLLNAPLDQDQKTVFYSRGGTYIEIETSFCDFDCMNAIEAIENLARTYAPYVYVYRTQNAPETKITVENYGGQENITYPDAEIPEQMICEVIPGHPACIQKSAINAALTTPANSTA